MKTLLLLPLIAFLAACAGPKGDYQYGVDANRDQYKLYSDLGLAQQNVIGECFRSNPNKSECSILAAGTNATQTLGGRPDAIRVAKSSGEIMETIVSKGLNVALGIYGFKQVSSAVQAGFTASSKAPLVEVIRPEIVRPEVILVPQ